MAPASASDISNFEVEVNMGEVCYMRQLPNHTALYFDPQVVTVRESISETRAAAEQTRNEAGRFMALS